MVDEENISWRRRLLGLISYAMRSSPRPPDPPNVTVPLWLVRGAMLSKWVAASIAAFFLFCFCAGTTGDQTSSLHFTHVGTWVGDVQWFIPLMFGFGLISIGIPLLAQNVVSVFVALSWRGQFWPKLWALLLMLGVSLAMILTSFSVMSGVIIEHGRPAAVAVEEVQQRRGALTANVDAIQRDIDDIAVPAAERPTYQMQACRAGATAWAGRIATAQTQRDYQEPAIARALDDARRCDTLRDQRRGAMGAVAASGTIASVMATPASDDTVQIAAVMGTIKLLWPLIASVLNDFICLVVGWLGYHLQLKRNRQLAEANAALPPDDHMIRDMRDEAPRSPEPMTPAREVVRDGETGEELIKIKPKEYWRKRKGQKQAVETGPIELPDEVGVPDGAAENRAGLTPVAAVEQPEPDHHDEPDEDDGAAVHISLPDLSEADLNDPAVQEMLGLVAPQKIGGEQNSDIESREPETRIAENNQQHISLPDAEGVLVNEPTYDAHVQARQLEDA